MMSLRAKLLVAILIAMLALTCEVLAKEVAAYRVGDYFKYRVESKFMRVDGKEFTCRSGG